MILAGHGGLALPFVLYSLKMEKKDDDKKHQAEEERSSALAKEAPSSKNEADETVPSNEESSATESESDHDTVRLNMMVVRISTWKQQTDIFTKTKAEDCEDPMLDAFWQDMRLCIKTGKGQHRIEWNVYLESHLSRELQWIAHVNDTVHALPRITIPPSKRKNRIDGGSPIRTCLWKGFKDNPFQLCRLATRVMLWRRKRPRFCCDAWWIRPFCDFASL